MSGGLPTGEHCERDRMLEIMKPGRWYLASELQEKLGWTPTQFRRYSRSLHTRDYVVTRKMAKTLQGGYVEWALA